MQEVERQAGGRWRVVAGQPGWACCGRGPGVSGCLWPGRQEAAEAEEGIQTMDAESFKLDGEVFRAGDHVFLLPDTFDQLAAATVDDQEAVPTYAAKSRHVKVLAPPLADRAEPA